MAGAIKTMLRRVLSLVRYAVSPARREFHRAWPQIDRIEGWLVPGQEEWLYNAARSLPEDATIVEIGCYHGRSTACLALGCVGTNKHVYSIDLFGGVYSDSEMSGTVDKFDTEFQDKWRSNMEAAGLSGYATPIKGSSKDIAKTWSRPIDFLFIDGSHQYEDVIADFDNFFGHVVPGGLVGMHDVAEAWEGCYRAWHEHVSVKLADTGLVTTLGYGRKPRAK